MCNVSDVPPSLVRYAARDRGRRRLAVRQVRAELGCRAAGGGQRIRRLTIDHDRVGRRGTEGSHDAALDPDAPRERLGGTP